MSESLRTLKHIHETFSPALSGRIITAVLLSLFFGAASSPLAGPWLLLLLTPVLLIGVAYLSLPLSRKGLRANDYAPMRADDDTPTSLGGTVEEPRSPNRKLHALAPYAGSLIYALMWIGQSIDPAALG